MTHKEYIFKEMSNNLLRKELPSDLYNGLEKCKNNAAMK
ncbi:MAG: hypothetical protein ACJAUV_000704 [Flavobacteriales bacterium]|jgi:hypothetical protein